VDGVAAGSGCGFRVADGEPCNTNADCHSMICENGACFHGSGRTIGEQCVGPTDCQSRNCLKGLCYGAGPSGKPCTNDLECLSGHCINGNC
jgi:hypothetical protein